VGQRRKGEGNIPENSAVTEQVEFTSIKIVSDGTSNGTKVFVQESGKTLANVQSINWHIDVHGLSVVTLVIQRVPVEMEAEKDKVQVQMRHIVL
jgi:hypothetical protein